MKCAELRRSAFVGLTLFVVVFAAPLYAQAPPVVVNFDAVDAWTNSVEATPYLRSFGATLSGVTPGTSVRIINNSTLYSGQAAVPTSPPNLFTQTGLATAISFTIVFNTMAGESFAVGSVTFNRAMLLAGPSGVTHPEWSAHAFDASGTEVATVGESLIASFVNVPAQTFTLSGPGIVSVRFDSDAHQFAGFGAVLIDDLVLQP